MVTYFYDKIWRMMPDMTMRYDSCEYRGPAGLVSWLRLSWLVKLRQHWLVSYYAG